MTTLFLLLALAAEPKVSIEMDLSACVASGRPECVAATSGTLTAPLRLQSGQTIRCEPGVEITCRYGATLIAAIPVGIEGPCIDIWDADNVTIEGCTLIGEWTGDPTHPVSYRSGMHGVGVFGSANATIRDCRIVGFHGDGAYIGPLIGPGLPREHNENFHVAESIFDGNYRQGVSVVSGRGLIEDSVFSNTRGAPPHSGLDIEPADGSDVIDVTVRRCNSFGNAQAAYLVALHKCRTNGQVPLIRFESCVGETHPPWQVYRFADCFKTRKDANGAWTATNDGHPAEQLPVGTLIQIDGTQILLKR